MGWWTNLQAKRQARSPAHHAREAAGQPTGTGYSTDRPIDRAKQDRFARAGFAQRIADTIASRMDSAGLVLGLYGPWGDGKTSVLHMIEERLKIHADLIVVRFNPWHFTSEEQLLKGFFGTLAAAIGKSVPTKKQKIGKLLSDYNAVLEPIKVGGIAKALGAKLAATTLEESKERIEGFLKEANKHVVVIIDDIDRLDRAETHLIFKLVKLSADFAYTTYLLSFDDAVVAAALGERYGAGEATAGRAFLEKIIQVPLHLPPAETVALRKLVFEGVDRALDQAGITLSQAQTDAFVMRFTGSLELSLTTPRQAHLYANALLFALPMVKGEVNIAEFMLIEALRLFHPRLHRTLRENPGLLLSARDQDRGERQRQLASLIEKATPEMTPEHRERMISGLLNALFPRMAQIGYGHDWDAEWAREQRVCAPSYFHKFFAYGVSINHLSDRRIQTFLDELTGQTLAEQDAALQALAAPDSVGSFVQRLRQREGHLPPDKAAALALAIARNGAEFPRERGAFSSGGPFTQAAIAVFYLIKNTADLPARLALAQQVLRTAQPLLFAVECLTWLFPSPSRAPDWAFDEATFPQLNALFVQERLIPADAHEALYRQLGTDASVAYHFWHRVDAAGLAARLARCLDAGAEEVDWFLDAFVGNAWTGGAMDPHRTDFDRDDYNNATRLIDGSQIAQHLHARYGAALDAPLYRQTPDVPLATRVAHQFMVVHARALAEAQEHAQLVGQNEADAQADAAEPPPERPVDP